MPGCASASTDAGADATAANQDESGISGKRPFGAIAGTGPPSRDHATPDSPWVGGQSATGLSAAGAGVVFGADGFGDGNADAEADAETDLGAKTDAHGEGDMEGVRPDAGARANARPRADARMPVDADADTAPSRAKKRRLETVTASPGSAAAPSAAVGLPCLPPVASVVPPADPPSTTVPTLAGSTASADPASAAAAPLMTPMAPRVTRALSVILSNAEILETIFCYVSTRDLDEWRRVSQQWRHCSQAVLRARGQQRLVLRLIMGSTGATHSFVDFTGSETTANPLQDTQPDDPRIVWPPEHLNHSHRGLAPTRAAPPPPSSPPPSDGPAPGLHQAGVDDGVDGGTGQTAGHDVDHSAGSGASNEAGDNHGGGHGDGHDDGSHGDGVQGARAPSPAPAPPPPTIDGLLEFFVMVEVPLVCTDQYLKNDGRHVIRKYEPAPAWRGRPHYLDRYIHRTCLHSIGVYDGPPADVVDATGKTLLAEMAPREGHATAPSQVVQVRSGPLLLRRAVAAAPLHRATARSAIYGSDFVLEYTACPKQPLPSAEAVALAASTCGLSDFAPAPAYPRYLQGETEPAEGLAVTALYVEVATLTHPARQRDEGGTAARRRQLGLSPNAMFLTKALREAAARGTVPDQLGFPSEAIGTGTGEEKHTDHSHRSDSGHSLSALPGMRRIVTPSAASSTATSTEDPDCDLDPDAMLSAPELVAQLPASDIVNGRLRGHSGLYDVALWRRVQQMSLARGWALTLDLWPESIMYLIRKYLFSGNTSERRLQDKLREVAQDGWLTQLYDQDAAMTLKKALQTANHYRASFGADSVMYTRQCEIVAARILTERALGPLYARCLGYRGAMTDASALTAFLQRWSGSRMYVRQAQYVVQAIVERVLSDMDAIFGF
ncbi:hypothetical protein CXG81DRAFT_18369 [Caulochytrium protostelioides]|uniref:F-box domain-containing protein n=1 Tax=Caulochytrium protostelioides TaxID=1555241 RepID=A0A4P9X1D8_9FUNG|nr:hypothetical protein CAUPRSCDRAFT_10425 [Caulochytrium protostelioides]RKP01868.1 hypothetical protein CXG81DRAFT_18369 [Caulochytrium protostelioides]|eukprot:RKP01868.1 hypothetical protein CXG81DRAFT_18369 [Caulochytrium protostelioides]